MLIHKIESNLAILYQPNICDVYLELFPNQIEKTIIQDPYPGSGFFFGRWIRDPGWKKFRSGLWDP